MQELKKIFLQLKKYISLTIVKNILFNIQNNLNIYNIYFSIMFPFIKKLI